ncbi:hypothetical protein BACCAC_03742 [Bacteroides caccae ATCC 43185]|nr:hypothetical protein BACCAC_03742 [Bacteroides caccae ATCC 43185]
MVIKKSNNPFAGKAKPGVGKKKLREKESGSRNRKRLIIS